MCYYLNVQIRGQRVNELQEQQIRKKEEKYY